MSERAVIVGAGKTGVSCARHLAARGWRLAVTDSRAEPPGIAALRAEWPAAQLALGGFDGRLLDDAALVVASPGVPLAEPIFALARSRGLSIVGDVELFARERPAPTVGITGTNGKSTVTTLLGRMAAESGIRVEVGGNLGTPALELLQRPMPQLYVLELSSYQLESTHSLELVAGAVLNVTPDHMDRYATLQDYAAAKARIFAHCGTAVVNADDPLTVAMPAIGQQRVEFSLRPHARARFGMARDAQGARGLARDGEWLVGLQELRIAGSHNAANALAALALGEAAGLPRAGMLAALRGFPGLEHRTQWVADVAGVRYINDSKGTNVGATLAAVEGLDGPLVIVAGGDGKGQDFAPLAQAFAGKVRHVVLIGRDAPALAAALAGVCGVERAASLPAAVQAAARVAQPGDTVLLSPACASLDMFRDYAHRGAEFVAAVRGLTP